jgi:hypothetical protein
MTPNLPRAANDSRRGGAPAFTPLRLARPFLVDHPLARSTAMRFRLSRALIALGSDGGLVSRERLATVSRQGSRGTKAGSHECSRSSALPVIPAHRLHRIFAPRPLIEWTTPEAYAPQVTVTWPARLLVWAVMLATVAYCAAIWCGAAL